MPWHDEWRSMLARERIETWRREAEEYRLALAATASRPAAGQATGVPAPTTPPRRPFWAGWRAQLAASLRL